MEHALGMIGEGRCRSSAIRFLCLSVTVYSIVNAEWVYRVQWILRIPAMFNLAIDDYAVQQERLRGTLWHCAKCDALVSIHSSNFPEEPFCPTCFDSELEFCGNFDSILGQRFFDA